MKGKKKPLPPNIIVNNLPQICSTLDYKTGLFEYLALLENEERSPMPWWRYSDGSIINPGEYSIVNYYLNEYNLFAELCDWELEEEIRIAMLKDEFRASLIDPYNKSREVIVGKILPNLPAEIVVIVAAMWRGSILASFAPYQHALSYEDIEKMIS